MSPATYTILICTRNRCDILEKAIMSHLTLEVPEGVSRDMIVVDNGSTDQTREVVETFRQQAPFPVTYIHEDREGHSIALNTGCRAAKGDVIIFTDDDAFPERGWLTAIHDTFIRHNADWVYSPVSPLWNKNQAPSWYGSYSMQFVACLDRGPIEFVATEPGQFFYGVNHACRRDRIFQVGLYREDLGLLPGGKGHSGNDDELYFRALKNGCRIVYNPRVKVNHLISPARHQRQTHRYNTKLAARNQFQRILEQPPSGRLMLGMPRYYYRKPLQHITGWIVGVLRRDSSLCFFHEVQLVRFFTLIGCAVRHCFRASRQTGDASS